MQPRVPGSRARSLLTAWCRTGGGRGGGGIWGLEGSTGSHSKQSDWLGVPDKSGSYHKPYIASMYLQKLLYMTAKSALPLHVIDSVTDSAGRAPSCSHVIAGGKRAERVGLLGVVICCHLNQPQKFWGLSRKVWCHEPHPCKRPCDSNAFH